jgi:MoxR-like ATPase
MFSLPEDLKNLTREPSEAVQLPPSRRLNLRDPSGYEPDDGLVDAIKVALLLRKPLLVTGEPGTGKTDLGRYLAWKMNFLFFQFDAKSGSSSRDLYYTYDSLGRFQAGQSGEKTEPRNYIHFNALGEAILQSVELSESLRHLLPTDFLHQGPRQSVVVIDEIDKAPRDFPNDLLNELDQQFFRIPELQNVRFDAARGLEPLLVVTSNSEKTLPAPFLRRCLYFHIGFPKPDALKRIVSSRIQDLDPDSILLKEALEFFGRLRVESANLNKKPATAELLDWVLALLAMGADRGKGLREQPEILRGTLTALVKHEADLEPARNAADDFLPKTAAAVSAG